MSRFIHSADIHLDSPLKGLERYGDLPADEIRNSTRVAFRNLIDLAINENVDCLTIAGDLYDGNWPDYGTGIFFVEQAQRLNDSGIPLYLIAGNHDAENLMTKSLRLPELTFRCDASAPQSFEVPNSNIVIHGQSFATKAVRENLAAGYPPPIPGRFNLGLLHTCVAGKEGHENYAPCKLEELVKFGYDYWALGHIHQREVLHQSPHVVFSGNLQGRHIRESGEKGCYVVEIDNNNSVKSLEFHSLDSVRWERLQIAVDEFNDPSSILDSLCEALYCALEKELQPLRNQTLVVRVELTGQSQLHSTLEADSEQIIQEFRATTRRFGNSPIWLEKVVLQTTPCRDAPETDRFAAFDELETVSQEYQEDPKSLVKKIQELEAIKRRLPIDSEASRLLAEPDEFQNLVSEAHTRLTNALQKGEWSQ